MAKSRKKPARKTGKKQAPRAIESVLLAQGHHMTGEFPEAVRHALAALEATDRKLNVVEALLVANILKEGGEPRKSDAVMRDTRAMILGKVEDAPGEARANREAGYFLMEVGEPDRAEPFLLRTMELEPDDQSAAHMLLHLHLDKGRPDDLIAVWERYVEATGKPGSGFLTLAKALAHFGFGEHSLRMLDRASAFFDKDSTDFAIAAAAIRGEELTPEQRVQSIEMFDTFSGFYDENLAKIENNGPRIVGKMMRRLPFQRDGTLDILDAGCGTGLCVPFLRPYARHLHGFDFSVGMLEASRKKNIYDLLTRSDITVAATLPEGTFDLIVCADVFVYFGDLTEGLRNLATKLRPGGWLIFTTEDAGDADLPRGYEFRASGRYVHTDAHIRKALHAAGFVPPVETFNDTLRLEWGLPVKGRAVATRKLALLQGLGG